MILKQLPVTLATFFCLHMPKHCRSKKQKQKKDVGGGLWENREVAVFI